jgi:hypothetical protein
MPSKIWWRIEKFDTKKCNKNPKKWNKIKLAFISHFWIYINWLSSSSSTWSCCSFSASYVYKNMLAVCMWGENEQIFFLHSLYSIFALAQLPWLCAEEMCDHEVENERHHKSMMEIINLFWFRCFFFAPSLDEIEYTDRFGHCWGEIFWSCAAAISFSFYTIFSP